MPRTGAGSAEWILPAGGMALGTLSNHLSASPYREVIPKPVLCSLQWDTEGGGGAAGKIQAKSTVFMSPSSKEAFVPMWRPGPAGSAAAGSSDTSDGGFCWRKNA